MWKQSLLSDWNAKFCVLFSNKCCMFSVSAASATATVSPSFLSRPMQRKLVSLVNCQLIEEEGRSRAVKAARSLGERTVMELILLHQNPQQLSANLWAAVRARGCQFLGPGMCHSFLPLTLAPSSLFWAISFNSLLDYQNREQSSWYCSIRIPITRACACHFVRPGLFPIFSLCLVSMKESSH